MPQRKPRKPRSHPQLAELNPDTLDYASDLHGRVGVWGARTADGRWWIQREDDGHGTLWTLTRLADRATLHGRRTLDQARAEIHSGAADHALRPRCTYSDWEPMFDGSRRVHFCTQLADDSATRCTAHPIVLVPGTRRVA